MQLTELAHQMLEAQIREGDLTIDATAGNGYDTVKLAKLVGHNGHVISIDIQAQAIASTQNRLDAGAFGSRCRLIETDHAQALGNLLPTHSNMANAIIFNLGYLPGSDKKIQTIAKTTLPALKASATLLKLNGLLLVTAYRGHSLGHAEALAVAKWMGQQTHWHIHSHEPNIKEPRISPILWVARKPNTSFKTHPESTR